MTLQERLDKISDDLELLMQDTTEWSQHDRLYGALSILKNTRLTEPRRDP